jgi:hypothetical protein
LQPLAETDIHRGSGCTGTLLLPEIKELQDNLAKINGQVLQCILGLSKEDFTIVKVQCEENIGRLEGANPLRYHSQAYSLPDDRELMFKRIRGYWNSLSIQFLEEVNMVSRLKDDQLSDLVGAHEKLIEGISDCSLEHCAVIPVALTEGPHLTVQVKKDYTVNKMRTLQKYFSKINVDITGFEGFLRDDNSIVLYFQISSPAAKHLQSLPLPPHEYYLELSDYGILSMELEHVQWKDDIASKVLVRIYGNCMRSLLGCIKSFIMVKGECKKPLSKKEFPKNSSILGTYTYNMLHAQCRGMCRNLHSMHPVHATKLCLALYPSILMYSPQATSMYVYSCLLPT